MKITIETDNTKHIVDFGCDDVTVKEILDTFIGLLVGVTYQMGSIEDAIVDKAEVITAREATE